MSHPIPNGEADLALQRPESPSTAGDALLVDEGANGVLSVGVIYTPTGCSAQARAAAERVSQSLVLLRHGGRVHPERMSAAGDRRGRQQSAADGCRGGARVEGSYRGNAAAEAGAPHRCELEDGPALALDTARRLACDASVVGIVEGDEGEPLDIGRKTRSIPPAIARALRARDGGCRFPGCDRTRFCQGHHIEHWGDGGETKLDNLITLCSFHHRLVHEGGYGVRRTDDGLFIFTRPDGKRVEENGVKCFRRNILLPVHSTYRGFEDSLRDYMKTYDPALSITAETTRCQWHGESMDYSQAVEAMQFLEHKAAVTEPVSAVA